MKVNIGDIIKVVFVDRETQEISIINGEIVEDEKKNIFVFDFKNKTCFYTKNHSLNKKHFYFSKLNDYIPSHKISIKHYNKIPSSRKGIVCFYNQKILLTEKPDHINKKIKQLRSKEETLFYFIKKVVSLL